MHHDMLDAVQEKHMLRPVFEAGLQHGVSRDDAEEERGTTPNRRALCRRSQAQPAHKPKRHQRGRQIRRR
jgi:hypothetical protein